MTGIPGYNPGPNRTSGMPASQQQRLALRAEMAVALGVDQQDFVSVDHDVALALGLGEKSKEAKQAAFLREAHKEARAAGQEMSGRQTTPEEHKRAFDAAIQRAARRIADAGRSTERPGPTGQADCGCGDD